MDAKGKLSDGKIAHGKKNFADSRKTAATHPGPSEGSSPNGRVLRDKEVKWRGIKSVSSWSGLSIMPRHAEQSPRIP